MQPGEYLLAEDEIVINSGRAVATRGGAAHRRPSRAGRQPLPLLSRSIQRSSSIARLLTACASISLQAQPRASSRAMRGQSPSSPLPALVTCGVTAALWTES